MATLKLPPGAPEIPADLLPGFENPEDVLDELHRPMFFTCRNKFNMLLLGYVAAEDAVGETLLFAPTTAITVAKVKNGQTTMLEALTSSWLMAVQFDGQGQLLRACSIDDPMTLQAFLPTPGTTLHLEHMPVLAARAIGAKIGAGHIPASVVVTMTDSVRKAMKLLMDFVQGNDAVGRPSNESRTLFDLVVQRFLFRSFEVSFGTHVPFQQVPQIKKSLILLQKGLEWARSGKIGDLSEEEKDVALRALYMIAPPSVGHIDSIEIGGSFLGVGERSFKLNKKLRKRISLERGGKGPKEVLLQGHLFEANAETMTCQMRVTRLDDSDIDEPGQVYTLAFDESEFYQVAHAAVEEAPARVFGTAHPKKAMSVDVQSVQLRMPISDPPELESDDDGQVV